MPSGQFAAIAIREREREREKREYVQDGHSEMRIWSLEQVERAEDNSLHGESASPSPSRLGQSRLVIVRVSDGTSGVGGRQWLLVI